jgi:hypothetical protein
MSLDGGRKPWPAPVPVPRSPLGSKERFHAPPTGFVIHSHAGVDHFKTRTRGVCAFPRMACFAVYLWVFNVRVPPSGIALYGVEDKIDERFPAIRFRIPRTAGESSANSVRN